MLAKRQNGTWAQARQDYLVDLVLERMTKTAQGDGYINAEMQRGIDLEPKALAAYRALSGNEVRTVGFVQHDELMAGCSPDGLIGDDGLLEIKCPKAATHLSYLRNGLLPTKYIAQVNHSLWITGAAYCDFVSFDDRWPERYQIFHVRVHRNEKLIAEYERAAKAFLKEVDLEVASLKGFSVLTEVQV